MKNKNNVEEKYFACWFRLNKIDKYLIWISGEPDSVLLNTQGNIPVFNNETSLAKYTFSRKINIENETPLLHDLDVVEQWLIQPATYIDCRECLSAWNLFADVAYTLRQNFIGNKLGRLRNRVYDKLFYGSNILDLTPDGEYYIPQWSDAERKKLYQILNQGLYIFKNGLDEMNIL